MAFDFRVCIICKFMGLHFFAIVATGGQDLWAPAPSISDRHHHEIQGNHKGCPYAGWGIRRLNGLQSGSCSCSWRRPSPESCQASPLRMPTRVPCGTCAKGRRDSDVPPNPRPYCSIAGGWLRVLRSWIQHLQIYPSLLFCAGPSLNVVLQGGWQHRDQDSPKTCFSNSGCRLRSSRSQAAVPTGLTCANRGTLRRSWRLPPRCSRLSMV